MNRTTKAFTFLCGVLFGAAASTAALASLGFLAAREVERDSQQPAKADLSGGAHTPASSNVDWRAVLVADQSGVSDRADAGHLHASALVVSPVSKEITSNSESVDDADLLNSIEARHSGDFCTQAATLYRAHLRRRNERIERERVEDTGSQKPDATETALLDKAIERIEIARLELLALRLKMYESRARSLDHSRDLEARRGAYEEVLRLFEEVQHYSKLPLNAEPNWRFFRECQNTYANAALAFVRSGQGWEINDTHYRGKLFYSPGFKMIHEHNPLYSEPALEVGGHNEAHALLWLRGILDRENGMRELDIEAGQKPAALKHLQAVRMILEEHMRRQTERSRQFLLMYPPRLKPLPLGPPDPPPEDRKRERAELIPDE